MLVLLGTERIGEAEEMKKGGDGNVIPVDGLRMNLKSGRKEKTVLLGEERRGVLR